MSKKSQEVVTKVSRFLINCSQTGQKGPGARLRRELPSGLSLRVEDSRAAREKLTSGGVLRQYVGATPFGAGMIPAQIERNYPNRLLKAGWWQMALFQRSGAIRQ